MPIFQFVTGSLDCGPRPTMGDRWFSCNSARLHRMHTERCSLVRLMFWRPVVLQCTLWDFSLMYSFGDNCTFLDFHSLWTKARLEQIHLNAVLAVYCTAIGY